MASGDVLIYGAGMSGMIAAYNLAVEGHGCWCARSEPGFGGSSRVFNPSRTPRRWTSRPPPSTSALTIAPAFQPVSALTIYLHDLPIDAPVFMAYHVERSSRPQSLDALLYGKCVEAGVELRVRHAAPRGRHGVATARHHNRVRPERARLRYLGIPYVDWYAWMASGEMESRGRYAWIWLDECINEYGYISYCQRHLLQPAVRLRAGGGRRRRWKSTASSCAASRDSTKRTGSTSTVRRRWSSPTTRAW